MDENEETVDLSLEAAEMLKEAGNADGPGPLTGPEQTATGGEGDRKEAEVPGRLYTPEEARKRYSAPDYVWKVYTDKLDSENGAGEQQDILYLGEGDEFETRFGLGKVESIVAHPNGMHAKVVVTAIVEVTAAELAAKLST